MNPCLITIDGGRPGGLDRLRASAVFWDWPLVVLPGPWRGWGDRLKRVVGERDRLRNQGYTHLISIDAYDTVVITWVKHFGFNWKRAGSPAILLAAEAGCWPDAGRITDYPPRETNWWYAHSQFTWDLRQDLPFSVEDVRASDDDQRFLTNVYLQPTPGVALDTACRIVQSIAFSAPEDQFFEIKDGRLRNKQTGWDPLILHGNGGTTFAWFQEQGVIRA